MFPGENDGDRRTPLLFDSLITPIFPESAVREVMARAEAMERAASQAATAAPPRAPLPTAPAPTPVVWPKAAPVVESWKADTPMNGVRVRLPAATLVLNDDDDDVDPPTALHVLAGRGHHVSWMFWVAMALLLALLTATLCKAAMKLSLHEVNSAGSGQISV
ncbi:hypothetical protein LVJ94_31635 [Pendulispora rubella]|uniref:Uncharacterized protein n=1 Tax=Pendulispora rubella TaxID=2741070 RepID=A0ABZ2KS26_9BACT